MFQYFLWGVGKLFHKRHFANVYSPPQSKALHSLDLR